MTTTEMEQQRRTAQSINRQASELQKEIAAVYFFESESSPGRTYQTLQYTDGTTSCNCKGWTIKRPTAGGMRSCRHTRDVDAGLAQRHAIKYEIYSQAAPRNNRAPNPTISTSTQGTLQPRPGSRRFNFEE